MTSLYNPQINFPAPGKTNFPSGTQTATLTKAISSTEMATLQTYIQTNYQGVALDYSGLEFAYTVVLSGRAPYFNNAYLSLVPRGRPDITRQPSLIGTP